MDPTTPTGDFDTDTGGAVNRVLTAAEQAMSDTALTTHTHTATDADPIDQAYDALTAAAGPDELIAAAEPQLPPVELVALRLMERNALAAEATYTLLAQLVNGLTSNPMVAAMMGGQ